MVCFSNVWGYLVSHLIFTIRNLTLYPAFRWFRCLNGQISDPTVLIFYCTLFRSLIRQLFNVSFVSFFRTELKLESLEDAIVLDDKSQDLLSDKHGCPAYVSPEILMSHSQYSGRAADMWGLGVMLYTMLVGRWESPFLNITLDPQNCGDLKSDHLKSRLFVGQISNCGAMAKAILPTFKKPDHLKSVCFCLDFKWFLSKWWSFVLISNSLASGSHSDPIRNPNHLLPNLFSTIQNPD